MARVKSTRSSRQDEGTKQRDLSSQPTPFLGLGLAPIIAILFSWLIHYAVTGITVRGNQWFTGSETALGGVVIMVTLGAVAVAAAAWHFSYDRQDVWRYALTVSSYLTVQWLALLVWVGPNRWWDLFFAVFAWIVVGVWFLPRLHVLRRDPRENDGGGEDDLMRELGLKGYKFGTPNIEVDDKGEETRRVYEVKHKLGGTRQPLTNALKPLESVFGAPEGLSRVVKPENGKSNRSVLTVMIKDPLEKRVPYLGPSMPGGSITDRAYVGKYDDGEPVYVFIAGGLVPDKPLRRDKNGQVIGQKIPPTGYAFMGMTRAGKTVTENRLLIDGVITRRDGVFLYLNQAKGEQDVAPIIDGVEVVILSDENTTDTVYGLALRKVKDIISYRQRQLARYGISAWSADKCFYHPPQHTLAGEPIPMDPMPGLIVHVGEADSILETAGDEAVYIASKGLSTGVIPGWSLQRWSATSMPTDLRFNIGTRFCFGVGDDYSAGFALSEPTIAAGAHPENWRNTKPGRYFLEGAGIEDHRWPVSAKGVGDEDDDTLFANMRRDAALYGPKMARLDAGSVKATGGWWVRAVAETAVLRKRLTAGPDTPAPAAPAAAPTPVPDDPTPIPTRQEEPVRRTAPAPVIDASPPTTDEDPQTMQALDDTLSDIANTTSIDGERIFGDLIQPEDPDSGDDEDGDQYFIEIDAVNPDQEIPVPADDGIVIDEGKPDAPTRADALAKLDETLRAIHADPQFNDPADPTGRTALVRTGQISKLYPFRSRTWYTDELAKLANGQRLCPPGLRVEKAPDPRGEGWYRISPDVHASSPDGDGL